MACAAEYEARVARAMTRSVEHLQLQATHVDLFAIVNLFVHRRRLEPIVSRIHARLASRRQTDCILVTAAQEVRRGAGCQYRRAESCPHASRTAGVIEVAMRHEH